MSIKNLAITIILYAHVNICSDANASDIKFNEYSVCEIENVFDKFTYRFSRKEDYGEQKDLRQGFDSIDWQSKLIFYIKRDSKEINRFADFYDVHLNLTPVIYEISDEEAIKLSKHRQFLKNKLLDVVNGVGEYRFFKKTQDKKGFTIFKSPYNQARWFVFENTKITESNILENWLATCHTMHDASYADCYYETIYKGAYRMQINFAGQFYSHTRELENIFQFKLDNHLFKTSCP